MKLVKIRINSRVDRIVNFDAKKDNQNNHYVIRMEDGAGEYNLLSISKKMAPYNTDIYVNSYTLTKDEAGAYELNIMLDENPDPKESQVNPDYDFLLTTYEIGGEVGFNVKNLDKTIRLTVNLVLGKKTKTFFVNFEELVFDAIIDFGSEASQACWKKDRNKTNINITEAILTERAWQFEKKGGKTVENNDDIKDYIQYESNNLYRSIYYMKKRLESTNISAWPDYTDDTIRFLMKNNEDINKEELMLIPNTKILFFDMSKYIEENVKIKNNPVSIANLNGDGVIQRLLMNNIVYQTLLSIQNYTETINNAKGSVVLNVLMPNIYPVHVVTRKLSVLAEDIMTLLKSDNNRFPNINMVELRAVSESDASLLGYLNSIRTKNLAVHEGIYLIIDAGKGTLDMSLMQVSPEGYTNKSRAGIVGAGNAVTYGVMLALVNEYLSSVCNEEIDATKIRRFIHGKILFKGNRDVASINRIMRRIEEYKRIYNDSKVHGKETPEKAVDEMTSFNQIMNDADRFARFERWIEEYNSRKIMISKASSRYIQAEIDSIVDEMIVPVANMLENRGRLEKATTGKRRKQAGEARPTDINVSTVVFTGRGCLMNELREQILQRLKDEHLIDESAAVILPVDSDPDYMKTICLNIFEILNGNSYDASPYMQTCSVINPVTGNASYHDPKPKPNSNLDPYFTEFFGKGGYSNNSSFKGNIEEGISVGTIETANSRLTIGGWMYTIKRDFKGEKCRVYFDGLDSWLISEDTRNTKAICLNDTNMESLYKPRLGFESLFPNVMTDNENLIAVPEFDDYDKEDEEYDEEENNDNNDNDFEKIDENPENEGGFFHALKSVLNFFKK